jgi:hypothetical protein
MADLVTQTHRRRRRHRARALALIAASLVGLTGLMAILYLTRLGPTRALAESLGIGRPQRVLPAVTPAVSSTDFTVENTDSAGNPVTYDPCKPIHYVINPEGAPADYLSFVQPAVQRAQAATGLEFVYDGVSSETFAQHAEATKAESVLISFPATLDPTIATGDTVGLGGSTYLDSGVTLHLHYVTGQIGLLRSWFNEASAEHRTQAEQAVVMHELGHVVGLGHVPDPTQLMYSKNVGQTDYGTGDLAGLALLGSGTCDP